METNPYQNFQDTWNKMTETQKMLSRNKYSDSDKVKLQAAGISFSPTWIDPQGRQVTDTVYKKHIAAGNDVSQWKPINTSAPSTTTIASPTPISNAANVPGDKLPTAQNVIDENVALQESKNKEMQANLEATKAKLDAQFATIENKFNEQQKSALERINTMESAWMQNYNQMKQMNDEFYQTQNQALDERVGGQQAGIASELSGKGISSGVIGNVVGKAQEAALSQYAALKETNINSLRQLNQEYLNFFQSIEATKKQWSDEEIALIKQKFEYAKELIDAGKTINQESITAAYAPQQAMIDAQATGVGDVLKYQAQDKTKIARYAESGAAERKLMLLGMLGLTENEIAAGTTSRFDIALLDKAVQAGDLGTAIQWLTRASAAAAASTSTSASGSSLLDAINKKTGTDADVKDTSPMSETNKPESPTEAKPKATLSGTYEIKRASDGKYYYIANGKRYSSTSLKSIQNHITAAGGTFNLLNNDALVGAGAVAGLYQQPVPIAGGVDAASKILQINDLNRKINTLTAEYNVSSNTNRRAQIVDEINNLKKQISNLQ